MFHINPLRSMFERYVKLSEKMNGAEVKEKYVLKAREERDWMHVCMHTYAILVV